MVTLRNACILMMSSLGMVAAVGCASRHSSIPESAQMVAADKGRSDFVAPQDGHVYVEDRSANKLLYSGKIDQGDHLKVDPKKNRVTINDQTVRDQKIRDLNNVRVFFKPEPQADVAGSRTIIVPVQPVQPAQPVQAAPAQTGESEIIVQPNTTTVKPATGSDSKVTVEPGTDGSKVTVEPK